MKNAISPSVRSLVASLVDYAGMLAVLAALVGVFEWYSGGFLTAKTLYTLSNQIPDAVIIAVGMTLVLIVGGIDLSVGSVFALSGGVLGVLIVLEGWPVWASIPVALAWGVACGAVNGVITVAWRIPPFIVTLGMLEMARGATYVVMDFKTRYIGPRIEFLAELRVLGLGLPFLVAMLVVIAAQVVLSRTVFGRRMCAVGANEEVARLSGISPGRVKLVVFMMCGALAALAAVVSTSRTGSATPNAGLFYELQAIAAVVIGGTSLMGGRGSVVRTFLGVLIIAVLDHGLAQMGARTETKRLITGAVIIAAVVVDHYRQKWSLRRR